MIEIVYAVAAVILLVLGLLGCVVPVIPGPALSFAAMLILLPSRFAPSMTVCVISGTACLIVLLLDSIVPAIGAKKFNCSKWGITGSIVGTVVGMFFGLAGLILGPFLGAVAGELMSGRKLSDSMKGGFGAFVGFVSGVLLKAVYCVGCAGWCAYAFYDVLSK